MRVRPAEDARFLDAQELVDAVLDFLGKELQPGDHDEGFLPALEVERARPVQKAEVAGEEPVVHGDLPAKSPRRVVGGEESVTPHRDLAQRLGG